MEHYFKFKDKGFVEGENVIDETSNNPSKSNNFFKKLNFKKNWKEN